MLITSKHQVIQILKSNLSYLKSQFKIDQIGIFGSYSRDDYTDTSDIDILVKFLNVKISLLDFIRLKNYLSEILSLKVDLVTPNALKGPVKENILMEVIYVNE